MKRGQRSACTGIYYLLSRGEFSTLHVLSSDETWFFHAGSGMVVHLFGLETYEEKRLGPSIPSGEQLQLTIRAGTTFAAELPRVGEWCLVGCTVCPGFEYEDFSLGDIPTLLEAFPDKCELIKRLGTE